MCGIAGVVDLTSPLGRQTIESMIRVLRHRGPDDEGVLATNPQKDCVKVTTFRGNNANGANPLRTKFDGRANLYIGHRRLAILDLSPAGHQPMPYGDDLWIVFNGEIYNYLELRTELKAEGYQFQTATDTEVILAAYDRWGEECVTRFNGDWAFCVLDLRRRILFLSRDRYGIKPLYFFRDDKRFAFASEIKAVLTLPFVKQTLNLQQALDYLCLFSLDHSEATFYSGIYQLKPGHSLVLDLHNNQPRISAYYRLDYTRELGKYDHQKALEYATDIRDLLFDAVRLRLRADVPIGTCLSGGLDSSSIVAITAKLLSGENSRQSQKTFTAAFPGNRIDESAFAKTVTRHTGSSSYLVYPSRDRCWADLPSIINCQDEPFGGTAIYAQWEVMREASRHVKVVLDGQGADEVFAGYRDYRLSFLAHLFAEKSFGRLAGELWHGASVAKDLRQTTTELKLLPFFNLHRMLQYRLYRWRYGKQFDLARRQLGVTVTNGEAFEEHVGKKYSSNMNDLLFHYITTYSLPHLLKYEDRNSMAHSIEARVPFTDYRLVDYVFSLPAVYKIHRGWTKWLLRLAMRELLPREILWRRDKLGFAAPAWVSREAVWSQWLGRTFPEADAQRLH